ncbi:transglutaminase domain-containing protein, partial [Thermodesulfobacteriota bacterium]
MKRQIIKLLAVVVFVFIHIPCQTTSKNFETRESRDYCSVIKEPLFDRKSSPVKYDYSEVDKYALNTPKKYEQSIDLLRDYLINGTNNDFEKVRSVFTWIANNINYDIDSYFSENNDINLNDDILITKKAVCGGFAQLFEDILSSEVKTITISGYAKDSKYSQVDRFNGKPNHVWNAVKIDSKWYLLDVTWAAGHINKNKKYVKEFDDTYFLTPPEHFIFDHLPIDNRWQLISTPISLNEFEELIHLKASFFAMGFSSDEVFK